MTLQHLNQLIDSLDLRISRIATPSGWLKTEMAKWRDYQDNSDFDSDPLLVELPELGIWRLKFSGRKPYEFILINPEIGDIYIWNPDKWDSAYQGKTGQLYLSFRSKFLQYEGVAGVRRVSAALQSILFASARSGFCRISRADLALDVQLDRDLDWQDLPHFVSRARYRDDGAGSLVEEAKEILDKFSSPPQGITRGVLPTISAAEAKTIRAALDSVEVSDAGHLFRVCHKQRLDTMYFGRFKSPCYARIYNKLASLRKQDKEYMRELWAAAGWDEESPVWRVEFSLSGDFLKDAINLLRPDANGEIHHDLREFDTFIESIPEIWRYFTYNWLRHCLPNPDDKNLWRAPISEFWQLVQAAFAADTEPIVRCKPPRVLDDAQLAAQARGLLLTIAAKRSPKDEISEESYSIWMDLWSYLESQSFASDLKERRKLLAIDDLSQSNFEFSDTDFSAQIRAERMLEDLGS